MTMQPLRTMETSGEREPRTLILCFDGTANQFDGDNTNVVKFYSLLKKDDDFDQQLCYYQPGVGTYFNPGIVSPMFQWCAKIMDEAFAWYLDEHVRGGYQFLMQNYIAGDKICIFGFSRGAYTARALAGMLHKIGLLPRDNPEQIPFAYKLYKNTDAESVALAAGFKQTFCRDVQIEFVGVWETVTSVGVIMGRTLPFTAANTTIKTFRHALSLDEHRVKFQPNLYHYNVSDVKTAQTPESAIISAGSTSAVSGKSEKKAARANHRAAKRQRAFGSFLRRWSSKSQKESVKVSLPGVQKNPADVDLETGQVAPDSSQIASSSTSDPPVMDDEIAGGTDVLEVWFSGCHSDVGGGAVTDDTKNSLSDITLWWMVREVALAQCGVTFDQAAVSRAKIPDWVFAGTGLSLSGNATAMSPSSASNSNQTSDPATTTADNSGTDDSGAGAGGQSNADIDALQPIHDELSINWSWWLLEIVPTTYQVQNSDGTSQSKWWIHLGKGRKLPDGPKFHVSVRDRLQDTSLKYTPRAQWKAGTETYVE